MNQKLWNEIMTKGRKYEKGTTNKLKKEDVSTILATAEFFGATESWMRQIYFDLLVAKYKVYDWLAMCVDGRYKGYEKGDSEINESPLKVLVYSFLKSDGNYKKFIADLRTTDYQLDDSWCEVVL